MTANQCAPKLSRKTIALSDGLWDEFDDNYRLSLSISGVPTDPSLTTSHRPPGLEADASGSRSDGCNFQRASG
jgi:hypothetical protein